MAASFDWKKLSTTDKVISITSLVALISLFLPWEGASGPGYSYSVSGFSTSYGWLGALLVILAGVYVVMQRSGSNVPKFSYGPGVITLGLSVIGAVLIIVRWISLPRGSYAAGFFSYGPRIGIFLALIAAVVQAFFALRLFRTTGEALPWAK
jgi:hypothetical protein